jgi:hypothetical protein
MKDLLEGSYDEEDRNPESDEDWHKTIDWWMEAIGDFDKRAAEVYTREDDKESQSEAGPVAATRSKKVKLALRQDVKNTTEVAVTVTKPKTYI